MIKKRNVIVRTVISAAVLATLGMVQANAGSVSVTSRNVAREAFGSLVTSATQIGINAGGITYTFSTSGGVVINPSGTIYITLVPTGGKFLGAGLALTVPTTVGVGAILTTSTATVNASGEIVVTLVNTGTANAVLGVGASVTVSPNPTTSAANGGNSAVGLVTVTGALGLATGTSVTVQGRVGTLSDGSASNVEALSAAATNPVLTSSTAVTGALTTSAGVETVKVDLTSTPTAGTRLVKSDNTTTLVETLGSFTFTDAAVANQLALPNVPVNVSSTTAFTGLANFDLTLVSGAFTAGAAYTLSTNSTCVAGTFASTQTVTPTGAAVAATTTKVNIVTNAPPIAGTTYYICATFPSAAITPYQVTATGTYPALSASYLAVPVAAASLYNLANNGQTVDVRNFITSKNGGNAYDTNIRVINTGTIDAKVSAAWIYGGDGYAGMGASGTLINLLPAGGAKTMTSSDVEGAIGVPDPVKTSGAQPRLRVTAPTNALEVQVFLYNAANGVFTDLTGAQ